MTNRYRIIIVGRLCRCLQGIDGSVVGMMAGMAVDMVICREGCFKWRTAILDRGRLCGYYSMYDRSSKVEGRGKLKDVVKGKMKEGKKDGRKEGWKDEMISQFGGWQGWQG